MEGVAMGVASVRPLSSYDVSTFVRGRGSSRRLTSLSCSWEYSGLGVCPKRKEKKDRR